MFKRVIISLTFLGIIFLSFIFFSNQENIIEKDYFEKAGVSSFFYKDIIKSKGIPLNEKDIFDPATGKQDRKEIVYIGYGLIFMDKISIKHQKDYFLSNIKITDTNYQIGHQKIGIGTSKSVVDQIYKYNKKILDVDYGFIDGDTWIQFKFDQNNNVSEIMIYYGP